MLPPVFLLLVIRLALPRGTVLVADLHTGVFLDPRWSWARGVTLRLLRGHVALVTNQPLAAICQQADIRALIVHDPIVPTGDTRGLPRSDSFILCPLTYSNDEPVAALLDAAARLSHLEWVFTGRAPDRVREGAPANVRFSGWVRDEDYRHLLSTAAAVVALTTRDLTMQRAGYEALSISVPLVTSDYAVLREYFREAAVYADATSAESIADAVSTALRETDRLGRAADALRLRRQEDSRQALAELRALLLWPSQGRVNE